MVAYAFKTVVIALTASKQFITSSIISVSLSSAEAFVSGSTNSSHQVTEPNMSTVGGCKLKVYRSYTHFQFFQLNGNKKALGLHDKSFCMKRNHWDT